MHGTWRRGRQRQGVHLPSGGRRMWRPTGGCRHKRQRQTRRLLLLLLLPRKVHLNFFMVCFFTVEKVVKPSCEP